MVISLMAWTNSVYVDIACMLSMLCANIVMRKLIHHYAIEFNFQHMGHAIFGGLLFKVHVFLKLNNMPSIEDTGVVFSSLTD